MDNQELKDAVALVNEARAGRMTRRNALLRAVGGGAMIAAGAVLPSFAIPKRAGAQTVTDADIFNFALNFEYLEAEYYTLGAFGRTVEDSGVVTGRTGAAGLTFRANPQVSFNNTNLQRFMQELALDEQAHIAFVRSALGGAAVDRPDINYTAAFNAAAQAAGLGDSFDPFANETNFVLGALLFSDVTVTALTGASSSITDKNNLSNAAGLLGTEGYHTGGLRLRVYQAGDAARASFQKVSDARDLLDGTAADKDQPVVLNNQANLVPTDANSIVFARSTSEVLRIAYLTSTVGATSGGFFPAGVNGTIRTVTT